VASTKPADWRGEDAVSARFSRAMLAATSPWGLLTDPPLVAFVAGLGFLAWLFARERVTSALAVQALGALALLPIATALGVWLALLPSRKKVIVWLDGLPFPLENLNAALDNVGEELEVTLSGPATEHEVKELNAALELVSAEAFVSASKDEPPSLTVRLGVLDDKRLPARSAHARFRAVRDVAERVLVPLAARRGVVSARVR
jgi:hypothetical protein